MDDVAEVLVAARGAFDSHDWAAARDGFRSINDEHDLSADDEGFGWHEHHDDLFGAMASASSADYVAGLVPEWIPALDGVEAKLLSGARVADVGGYGGPTIMLALAYPASTFHGFDYHAESIEAARKAAAEAEVSDPVTFEVAPADSRDPTHDGNRKLWTRTG